MCAFLKQFVASIIVNNSPIRELNKNNKRTCIIPFGSEYKIRLKNYHNVRAKVEIFIDGTDVLFGEKLVLNPKSSIEIERFLTDNNSGNKFKFVSIDQAEKAGELNDPNNFDNGHIQIKFYKELEYSFTTTTSIPHWQQPHYYYYTPTSGILNSTTSGVTISNTIDEINTVDEVKSRACFASFASYPEPKKINKGVTLEGTLSNQKFITVSDFCTENIATIIDIWLEGKENVTAQKVNTIKDFVLPAFNTSATETQVISAKKWITNYLANQVDPKIKSILDFFILPILENKNSSEIEREKAKQWLSTLDM